MAKPKQIVLTEDGVITQEALLAYAGGKLSPEETTQIEKLLRDDPFAQDALEGMRSAAAPVEMKSVVTSLNTQLREKTGVRLQKKKGIEIHWATYAYAAVIVGILIGLGFVMIHFISDNDQRIAMNKIRSEAQESAPVTEEKIQAAPPASDTMPKVSVNPGTASGTFMMKDSAMTLQGTSGNAVASGSSGPYTYNWTPAPVSTSNGLSNQGYTTSAPVLADKKSTPAAAPPVSSTVTQTTRAAQVSSESDKDKDEVKYSVNGYDLQTGKEVKSQNYKSPVAANFESNVSEPKNQEQVAASALKKEKKREAEKANATPADNARAARALFDANNFKEAGKAYSKILSDQPDNPDALYFGGICDFYNGKGKQAEKNFDKLIKAGLFVDGSKWYKANVLIEKGKKDEAKQLLRDLINTNSSFKDRAVKKYEEIIK